jgi:hypothetical protein
MTLSTANLKVWNRFGLTMTNGTVTLSIPALELLLDAVRDEGRRESANEAARILRQRPLRISNPETGLEP